MTFPIFRASILAVCAAAFLTGCSADRTGECPTMNAVSVVSSQTVFKPGAAPDPSNQLYTVEIMSVKGACSLDKKATTAESSLEISFRATRAPSGDTAQYSVPYFVAVTEGTERVVAKKLFTIDFSFAPGQSTATFSDTVASTEVTARREKKTYDYQVLVGLQLTKEQLDYNRAQNR
jgi:hypothetical protein